MISMQARFNSDTLGMVASIHALVPKGEGPFPTLYLLHGLSDDDSIWQRRTSIERYADAHNIAVIMPFGMRSFYADMAHGYKHYTYIAEELPAVVEGLFPLSKRREDRFVAGLSMGGYGAFKFALNRPDRFAAAASLSGALDIVTREKEAPYEFDIIYGVEGRKKLEGSMNDLFHLAKTVAASGGPMPKLYQSCGTEDFLYADNVRFRDYVRTLPFDYYYEEEPAVHEWGYWDRQIVKVLNWLPLAGKS
ncbi:alpha/beta hydrolase [Paenibacillus cymbidii]|uniref:alpha/beta hydrolase n=1 Tax=Paenibacillus cymbidii TaxID=1639034 RepID=UPI00108165E1|nr:alpha/beta hydrolase family protein [Paenibacillus cymbidii]